MRILDVLNLGAGWQSSRLLLQSCRGELPRLDAAIFADTRWEPKAVYRHLEWLKAEAAAADIPVLAASAGDIRADAIDFRGHRRYADGRRHASLPLFVRNRDGGRGLAPRQCTGTYKIDVVDRIIRRELLGLAPGRRVPGGVLVRQWFGISDDERSRATFPGRYAPAKVRFVDLFGAEHITRVRGRWRPATWREHVYPLLNEARTAAREARPEAYYAASQSREDCGRWLAATYPDRVVPRSACVGCPFRSNAEWRRMRDEAPEEFADACDFDDAMRSADRCYADRRGMLVGTLYLHRQLVPLREADLDGQGEPAGAGCGTLFDGQDGLCGV